PSAGSRSGVTVIGPPNPFRLRGHMKSSGEPRKPTTASPKALQKPPSKKTRRVITSRLATGLAIGVSTTMARAASGVTTGGAATVLATGVAAGVAASGPGAAGPVPGPSVSATSVHLLQPIRHPHGPARARSGSRPGPGTSYR